MRDKMTANSYSRLRENYSKMFWILLIFAYLTSFAFTNESLMNRNDVLIDTLNSAALEVISLHSKSFIDEINEDLTLQSESVEDEMSRNKRSFPGVFDVPHLVVSPKFMHSYISDTGVGNREDLLIDHIQEERLQVNVPSLIKGWNYARFNSTDFVMAFQYSHLDVWRMRLTRDIKDKGLNFDSMNAFCSIDLKSEGNILNAIFYTKLILEREILYFAVTIEPHDRSQGFQLREYQVTYGECVSLRQSKFRNKPHRISCVTSQYRSALVVLFNNNEGKTELKFTQKSIHDEHSKVIEVYMKDAIDMDTFTINGFGYIAVSNTFVCEVYRLSEFIEHHLHSDDIHIPGIIDIKAFRLGFNHFLGLATNTDYQYLYVWHSGSFYLKQVINVGSVMKWNTIYIPTCRDDVLIHLLRRHSTSSAQIYRWNGQLRNFQLAIDDVNKKMSRNYQVSGLSQAAFSDNHMAYVLEVDTSGRSHLISFRTKLEPVSDPELMKGWQITDLMLKLKERFSFQQKYLQKLSERLQYAIRPKANKIIENHYLIRTIEAINGVTVSHIKTLENIIWQKSPLTPHDLKYRIKDLKNNIYNIKQRLGRVSSATNDMVFRNKPAIITGHKRFIGHNEISSLNGSTSLIGTVGRQDLNYVLSNLYRISRPQAVKGVKHFVKPIYVRGSVTTSYTNNIDLNKQIVTTNEPQIITGHISYSSQLTVTNDLTIKGNLNSFDLSRDIVFLNQPDIIYASKIFTSPVIIAQNVNAMTIDGIDLTHLFKNVLLSVGSQTMNSKLTLVKPLTANIISVAGQVNGIDISAMADQIVYKNRPVFVKGQKIFILDDLLIKNNLFVANKLDGRKIPEDFFTSAGNQVITGQKIIKGMTRFDGMVTVKGLIDGLHLPEDIVRLTKNETIFGPIIFRDSIIAHKNIEAHRLVDGVDLSELKLHSLKSNDKVIRSGVRFNRGVIIGSIDLNGSVNGVNLEYLFKEAVFKGSKSVEIDGTKHFRAHIDIERLFAERVNGVNISDFVSTNKNETIYAEKHFAGITSFNTINVKGLVDRVDIENLYNNRISLSRSERIKGAKNFLQEISISDWLSVGQRINGIIPQIDIVLKSKFQQINGRKIFRQNLNVMNLKAKNPVLVKGRVDKILINEFDSRLVRLNGHKSLPLNVILMSCNATITEVDKNINGINITNFANNVMSLSKPQTVFSPKALNNIQHFSQIISSKGISGVSISGLNANAVHLNGISQIRAPFTFAQHIKLEKPLVINGVVNGVNLSYIAVDSVYKSGPKLIRGHNIFKSGFRVNGDINAILFNGVDLSTQLLTNNRDHIIIGKVKFSNSLNISRGFELTGLINGIDLSEFNKKVMKINTRNLIAGNLELIGPTKILSNLKIAGKLNGIEMNKIFNDAVFLNGNQEINGIKTMEAGVQFLNNLNSISINNINIPLALKEIVFIDSPFEQYVNSPKIFTNDITTNGLTHANGLAILGPINGINLVNLNTETIKINRPAFINGVIDFKDNAVISNNVTRIYGLLNSIDLLNDVINLHFNNKGPQVIKGSKTFEHLVLNENAVINGLVNGLPLKSINANTLYTTGNQRVISHKKIKGMVQFNSGNNYVTILNGMKVQEELITLRDNQTISAQLIFNNPLTVNRNLMVRGYVSGVNLNKLVSESLVKDMAQILSQPIKFDTIVFKQDVKVDEHVDNVDLSALSHTVKQFTRIVNISKDMLLTKANRHSRISDYLFKSLEKSVFEIDQFVLYQVLDEVYGDHIEVHANGIFSLSSNTGMTSTVHTMKYNTKSEMFDTEIVTKNSQSVVHKVFYFKAEEYVINMNSIHSDNISSQITRSGQLVGSLGYFVSSVEVIEINENTALLISLHVSDGKLKIHSLESLPNNKNAFKQITELNVGLETSKVIAFLKEGDVYIVVARNYRLKCMTDSSGTLIFILRNYNTLELIQRISLLNIANVVHFENHGKHYLAMSDVTPPEDSKSSQAIFIYRNDQNIHRCSFSLFQKLEFDNAIHLTAFSFGTIHSQQQYITAANRSHVVIWKQEGESGFTTSWWLHTKNAQVITPIIASDHTFIIVGQNNKCHESLIFKAETRGIALAPIVFKSQV